MDEQRRQCPACGGALAIISYGPEVGLTLSEACVDCGMPPTPRGLRLPLPRLRMILGALAAPAR